MSSADEEQPLLPKKDEALGKNKWVRRGVTIFVILAWFISGIWVGCMIEGWSFITAVYVMVQIITTIGYGDILIERQVMKLWIAIYVLLGVLVLAGVASQMAADMLAKQEKMLKRNFKRISSKITGNKEDAPPTETSKAVIRLSVSFTLFLFFLAAGTIFYATYEQCSCSYGRTRIEGCEEFKSVTLGAEEVDKSLSIVKDGLDKINLVKDFEKCAATGGQVKTWIDSFYMSMVTLTTVGFGDHSPKSYYGRWFGVFWMLFGVVAAGNFIGAASDFILAREKEHKTMKISDEVFAQIDFDKDGEISRAEFRNYAYLHFEMVSEDDMNRIDAIFEGIDADKNGFLTYEECHEYFSGLNSK